MTQTVRLVALACTLGIGMAGLPERVTAQQTPVITELRKQALQASEGKEAVVVTVDFAPGVATRKHFHPGDTFVYVLDGSITMLEDGKPPVTLRAGELAYEPPKTRHVAQNASTTAPAKIFVIYMQEKGQPTSIRAE